MEDKKYGWKYVPVIDLSSYGHKPKTRFTYDLISRVVADTDAELLTKECDYKNVTLEKLNFKCKCGNEFSTSFTCFVNGKRKCRACASKTKRENSKNAITIEQIRSYIKEQGYQCELISDEYIPFKPLELRCLCGNVFYKKWEHIRHSHCQCFECTKKEIGDNQIIPLDEIRKRAAFKCELGDYTINKIVGRGSSKKIEVKHNTCGTVWLVRPGHFLLDDTGCPTCAQSKGEKAVMRFLVTNNIQYETEKWFLDFRVSRPLPFDFYLPDYNICIEYQGEQHYRPVKCYGGDERFKKQQFSDGVKKNYCKTNGIPLIEIPYTEHNIEDFLRRKLNACGVFN